VCVLPTERVRDTSVTRRFVISATCWPPNADAPVAVGRAMWLCDYVAVWLCDYVAVWLCGCVAM